MIKHLGTMVSSRKTIMAGLAIILFGACPLIFNRTAAAEPVQLDDIEGLETALHLQRVFATLAERVSPAVVVVTNKQVRRMRDPMSDLPPAFRFFFGIPEPEQLPPRQRVPQPAGRGSGTVIRADGHVLTNYHVIRDHDELEIMLHDGTVYSTAKNELEVVGVDQDTDLAMLRIIGRNGEPEDLQMPWLQFADTEKLQVGDWTIAVGAPFNFDYSVTVGVVSQKGRHGMRLHTFENYIQTDASINPGNSGGPLLNIRGEVIGINNFIVTGGGFSRGNTGVGFAIDGNLARQVAEQIIEEGEVIRPWLGISMQTLGPELQQEFGVDKGVLVSQAIEGNPAAEAGVRAGDVILKVGDQAVATPRDLQFAVLRYQPGDDIDLLIHRDGEEIVITVKATRRGDTLAAMERDRDDDVDILEVVGLRLETVRRERVLIAAVASGSPADAAGLQQGDIVLEVNHQAVNRVDEVATALQARRGGVAVLYIERRGVRSYVPLRIGQ